MPLTTTPLKNTRPLEVHMHRILATTRSAIVLAAAIALAGPSAVAAPPRRIDPPRPASSMRAIPTTAARGLFRSAPAVVPFGATRTSAPSEVPRTSPEAAARLAAAAKPYDQNRLRAGHLLRRAGFGPSPSDMAEVLTMGQTAWIDMQLNPSAIDDSANESKFYPVPDPLIDDFGYSWDLHWMTRMLYSRKQLQEKMTLVWHEHMPVSIGKIGWGKPLHDYEQMLRRNSLGSFRQMLADLTRDPAMLIYLDNNYNSAFDYEGNPVPPNENYARELLQLFSTGPQLLNMDGTPVLDTDGTVRAAYTEEDVRETARALTGWYIEDYREWTGSLFYEGFHDSGDKNILGQTLRGRRGPDGANEVEDVVDIIMDHPSTAPFISKMLIQKLATETPTPGYVQRVATVFRNTDGNLKQTVRAILTDAEFTSDAVVRSQFKSPLEHLVGAARATETITEGHSFYYWMYFTNHLPYLPPSVFSFYRPGKKGALVTASQVVFLDQIAEDLIDTYTDDYTDAEFSVRAILDNPKLKKPKKVVNYLGDRLLAAPLDASTKTALIEYFGGRITEEKVRGAIWLILTSPDFQRN